MTSVIRHGAEVHVVRPDRVYRTSVIVPFVGYQPQADVQAVAQAFTTGGPLATHLSGFGAPNIIQRAILGIKARLHARRARKFMAGLGQPWHTGYVGMGDPGANLVVASQVAPQMQSQMSMLEHLMQGSNPGHVRHAVGQAAFVMSHRRPYTYYRAG